MTTIQYCQHGCGLLATHTTKGSRWNSPFKGKPVHQCSTSHHACPAIKQKKIETSRKNFGTDYPWQTTEIIEKRKQINLEKYGDTCSLNNPEQQAKRKATMMERYGVEQPTLNKDIRDKATASLRIANKDIDKNKRGIETRRARYGADSELITKKTRDTQIANGRWVSPEKKTDWALYKFKVKQLTAKTYKRHKDLLNPLNLIIGLCDYQVDHIFSIRHGFEYNIPYRIIANINNLQLLWHIDNKSKHIRSDHTIQELIAKIIGT